MAVRDRGRRRRLAALVAAVTAGLTAAVWWCSRSPGAGVAVPAPLAASPSRPPPEWPFAPIDVARIGPPAAGPERRDPLLGAISTEYRHALVIEVNALVHCKGGPTARHSPSRRASKRPRPWRWPAPKTWPTGWRSAIPP